MSQAVGAPSFAGDVGYVLMYVCGNLGCSPSSSPSVPYYTPPSAGDVLAFGSTVSLTGTGSMLAVGAYPGGGPTPSMGHVYVYACLPSPDCTCASGPQSMTTKNPDSSDGLSFGYWVAFSPDGLWLAVGSPGSNFHDGAVSLYPCDPLLKTCDSSQEQLFAGCSGYACTYANAIAIAPGIVAVSAQNMPATWPFFRTPSSSVPNVGGVFVLALDIATQSWAPAPANPFLFHVRGGCWRSGALSRELLPLLADRQGTPGASEYFGTSLALSVDGSVLAVGAPGWPSSGGQGAVFIYSCNSTASW